MFGINQDAMRNLSLRIALRLVLGVATALVLNACSSTHSTSEPLGETTRTTMHREGVPGVVIVESTTFDATVAAIDATNRTVTIQVKDGRRKVIGCGPEVVNFEQLRVGDHVQALIRSELTLALAGTAAPTIDGGVAVAAVRQNNGRPGGMVTEQQEYTATITAINQRRREVTLRLPDDTTRTLTARPDVDLSQRKTGEKVAVRVAVAVAITVQDR